MSGTFATLEQLMASYPVLTLILRCLEPVDYRNMLLAGMRMPVSRKLALRHLIQKRCSTCSNTNATGPIIGCGGCHVNRRQRPTGLTNWCPVEISNRAHPSNLNGRHTCTSCREFQEDGRAMRVWKDLNFWPTGQPNGLPMCKEHCLEHFNPPLSLPPRQCQCLALMDKEWRCSSCSAETQKAFNYHAANFVKAWNHQYRRLGKMMGRRARKSRPPLEEMCCILGCASMAWTDWANPAWLEMCPVCGIATRSEGYR